MATEFYNFDYLVPGQRNAHLQWNLTLDQIDQAIHDMVVSGGGTTFTEADVRGTDLAGLSVATSTDVVAADTVLEAIGKLQAQLNPVKTTVSSFASGWAHYGSPWDNVSSTKYAWGEVALGGMAKPSAGFGSDVFTLPAGSRPPNDIILMAYADGQIVRVNVRASGQVQVVGASGTPDYVSFAGLRFQT